MGRRSVGEVFEVERGLGEDGSESPGIEDDGGEADGEEEGAEEDGAGADEADDVGEGALEIGGEESEEIAEGPDGDDDGHGEHGLAIDGTDAHEDPATGEETGVGAEEEEDGDEKKRDAESEDEALVEDLGLVAVRRSAGGIEANVEEEEEEDERDVGGDAEHGGPALSRRDVLMRCNEGGGGEAGEGGEPDDEEGKPLCGAGGARSAEEVFGTEEPDREGGEEGGGGPNDQAHRRECGMENGSKFAGHRIDDGEEGGSDGGAAFRAHALDGEPLEVVLAADAGKIAAEFAGDGRGESAGRSIEGGVGSRRVRRRRNQRGTPCEPRTGRGERRGGVGVGVAVSGREHTRKWKEASGGVVRPIVGACCRLSWAATICENSRGRMPLDGGRVR